MCLSLLWKESDPCFDSRDANVKVVKVVKYSLTLIGKMQKCGGV